MRKEMTTIGESCQFFNGKAHEKDIDAKGQFVVVNSKFISTDGEVKKFTTKHMFPLVENDIVMVMSDVPNGKALAKSYVIEEKDKYSLNQRICAIRTTQFNIRFLYYQLHRHPYLLAFNNGENQTNLRKGDILNCPLWKPSLEVQKQIVAILDQAFAAIDQAKANIEKNIQNAQELFQSKLNEIFSQKGEGWEEKTFGEVCHFVRGPFGGSLKKSMFKKSGYAIYEQQHAINDQFDSIRYFIDDLKFEEMKRFELKSGDVIMSCSGTMGKVAIVPDNIEKGIINQALLKLTPNNLINREYLKRWMESTHFFNEIAKNSKGAAIKNIASVKILKQIKVPVTSEVKQTEIIGYIDKLEENTEALLAVLINKRMNFDELKKSILQKAFAGELT
jgi:type I restriction enzyme S subunit